MPIEHPWDLRNIHAIFVALLAVIIDPAFLEPIRIAFFNMRAPPRVPQPRQNAAQRNSEDYVTIVRVLALEPQIRRHTVVLPRNPNAIERDGDATDEEDEPERSPQEVAAENLARDIHQQQEEKERRIQESIANGSSNGGASRGNGHGAVRATPYGRRPGASSSNARRGPAGPNGSSNGPNAGAGPSNYHNALGVGPGPNNYPSNNYSSNNHPSNQQNGPSNNSNSRNAVAGPSNHPNALRDTTPGNDANRENAVAGPSNHPNALRLDSTPQNAEAGPSHYSSAQRADAGPSNPPATRREDVPDFDILDLSSLRLNDNSSAMGKGKGKQRAETGSRSAHQLPTSSSQNYHIIPQSLLESFDPRDLFEEESSSNVDVGVSSISSGFVPTPAPAQEQSSQPSSRFASQPSLLSRLSAQAEAPTRAGPSPVPTNPVVEAARPQQTFQQQQTFQPSPFYPTAAWNTDQRTSSRVPINVNLTSSFIKTAD
ncbi:hypothetical protein GALMADRAFT_1183349 [Galerina marginata CBS 339.88]|uniref:Uncharacterized protein n=1 Tax=Galerina marginata (strain CBS 339.88) TaxID=685588 RepID=A0A067TCT9_GALM3|nr:hypothetical protein GALMADRAFT_1183349 [Galerina marginata CBS 339.88]